MDQLNLNQLRSLVVLLEERHVSRAADRLNLTQSAISKQLSQLRDYFSDELLIRDGSHYIVSARGGQILSKVQSILSDIDELTAEEQFDPRACKRTFRFASSDYVAQFIFPNVVERIRKEALHINLVYEMWKPEWINRLGQMPLDFVSVMGATLPENITSLPLGQDTSVCMMARKHPLLQKNKVTVSDLLDYSYVRLSAGSDKDSFFDRYLDQIELSRRISFEVPFFSAAFEVIAQSESLMIVPEHIAINAGKHYEVGYCELPLEAPVNQYELCWHIMHDQDKAHSWVRRCIEEEMITSMYSP